MKQTDDLPTLYCGLIRICFKVSEWNQSEFTLLRTTVCFVAWCVHVRRHTKVDVWRDYVFEILAPSHTLPFLIPDDFPLRYMNEKIRLDVSEGNDVAIGDLLPHSPVPVPWLDDEANCF